MHCYQLEVLTGMSTMTMHLIQVHDNHESCVTAAWVDLPDPNAGFEAYAASAP